MPGGNRTGPHGDGPMTGRRMGYCVSNNNPGSENFPGGYGYGFGRGRGFGRGMGYGFRHGNRDFANEITQNVSKESLLENEARILKEQLASLEKQLSDIKKKKED